MASINDMRDVLGMAEPSPQPFKRPKIAHEKKEGISRELSNLLGDSNPPVVTIQAKFKEKPKFKQLAARWTQTPFTNGARKDGLVLSHWTCGTQTTAVDVPYRFESFNKQPDIISYTDEEYTTYLEKPDWTKEETDALVDLCADYDLRFLVIHDRWPDTKFSPRTIEQLKDRYYSISRSLLASRGLSTEGLNYDFQRETTRKQYLEELFKRTPQELEEENKLIAEAKRLEANEKALAQQKADLLRLLETPAAQGSYSQYTTSQGLGSLAQSLLTADKQKHKKRPSEMLTPSASFRQKHRKLSPREEREYGVVWHDKLSSGAYLRSQKTVVLKQTVAAKVQAVMQELGMSNVLSMPTEKTVKRFDMLQQKIGILLEAKRVCDKISESTAEVKEE